MWCALLLMGSSVLSCQNTLFDHRASFDCDTKIVLMDPLCSSQTLLHSAHAFTTNISVLLLCLIPVGKRLIQSDVDVFIAKMLYDFWQKIVYYKYELSSFRYQIPDNRSGCTASALCPNDTAAVLQLLDCAGRWYIAGSRHLRGPSLSLTFFVDKFKYWVPLTITIHHLSSCCPALPSGVNVAINLGKCQNIAILW